MPKILRTSLLMYRSEHKTLEEAKMRDDNDRVLSREEAKIIEETSFLKKYEDGNFFFELLALILFFILVFMVYLKKKRILAET